MPDALRPILELSVVLPGLLLAYIPVKTYLKQTPARLLGWLLPLFAALGIAIPVFTCRAAQRYSVVGRLRQE